MADELPEMADAIREMLQTPGMSLHGGGPQSEIVEDLHTIVAWIETRGLSAPLTINLTPRADGRFDWMFRCHKDG